MHFIDLAAQQRAIKPRIDNAIAKVLEHGKYIMGPEIGALESALSQFCEAKHTISCSSGTDALALVLMAKGVKPGDAVFCPSFTFASTGEVVAWLGAQPIFVDIDPKTFNMCPYSLAEGIAHAQANGMRLAGVMPVDLFGLPADYDAILPIAAQHSMWVLCDAAQGFGGIYKGQKVGSIGDATATSFFPAKPLGCYGDGGAVFTNDDALAEILASLRVHGKGTDKYDNVRIGMNGRLDTIQAAILLEKLAIFPAEITARNRLADFYTEGLSGAIQTPDVPEGLRSVWAQYTLVAESTKERTRLQEGLKEQGIPTMVYYPKPLHQQTAYSRYPTATGGTLPHSEDLAQRVFSLPMHPYMSEADSARVITALRGLL
jgi:dTDP-4-amino-4,6-dideoxygalactose transaminase